MNLLSCLERASLFGVAALGVALFLQWILADRVPASWRVWLWRAALIQTAIALVPFAPIALSVLPTRAPIVAPKTIAAPLIETAPILPSPDAATASEVAAPTLEIAPPILNRTPTIPIAPIAIAPTPRVFDWRALLVAIYGLGVSVQLAILARNALRVRQIIKTCTPLDGAPIRPLAARLNIRNAPRLMQSAGGAPFLVGLRRPTIVLPQTLDSAHIEAVLAHELAHHRRKDLAWNTVLWALQTLLWFHPLSWFTRRYHALEIESACDALTLQWTPIAPKSYGALLIGTENTPTSPLTAGVNDGFFALSTRLKRLGRAPMQPRRHMRWLLSVALLVSFIAVVPFELRARAQSEAEVTTKMQNLRGTVRDSNGKPVGKATVYIMEPMDNGGEPMAQTQTDADGKFALDNLKIDKYGVAVFVDAGARGIIEKQFDLDSADNAGNFSIKLPHRSFASLWLLNQNQRPVKGIENQRPVKGVEVRLFRVGTSFDSWMAMPRAVKARYRATTDATGSVKFPPLPMGMLAQFELTDQISKPTKFGLGDLRGGQYAPLAAENAVRLNRTGVMRSVTLVPSIRIEGRVTLEDGKAKGNVLILARRINAAEAAGKTSAREQMIAQTRSNAQGRYAMDGLRPGRYYVWVYPEKQLVKDFIGPSYERDLNEKTNRVDFQLSRGALIQGVVVAKNTGKPVKGQTMWLFDSQENNQYVITDASGYFKFRALGGKQRLRVHENGSNSPPPGFFLPAQSEFNFTIKNGQKRDFKIEMPGAATPHNTKPIGGIVLDAGGAPVSNATVVYRTLSGRNSSRLQEIKADAQGRFTLSTEISKGAPVQLFADLGEQTTRNSVVALSGDKVSLQLAKSSWANLNGQVVDENKKPLAEVKLSLATVVGDYGLNSRQTTSDAQGRYRFERLRPGTGAMVKAIKDGYSYDAQWRDVVNAGQNVTLNVMLKRANKTLSGTVLLANGKPASGFQIWADGLNKSQTTRKDGNFYLPQVLSGPIQVRVTAPRSGENWRPFNATGGDKNLVLRLSKDRRYDGSNYRESVEKRAASLIGKAAPAIKATRWSNNQSVTLASLRGQTALLIFGDLARDSGGEKAGLARALKGRVQVVGVQWEMNSKWAKSNADPDELAKKLGVPIAIDAFLPTKTFTGWQTTAAYGGAPYAVIGRDGTVIYTGDKIERAVELVTAN